MSLLTHNNLILSHNNKLITLLKKELGYKYFLFYVEEPYEGSEYMQQDFALLTETDKITGFTALAGKTSSNPSEENYPNGFDDDETTKWYSSGTSPNWCIFTKNETYINPIGISYLTSNDQIYCSHRSPKNWKLCGSNILTTDPNSTEWNVIYSTTDDTTFYNVKTNYTWVDEKFTLNVYKRFMLAFKATNTSSITTQFSEISFDEEFSKNLTFVEASFTGYSGEGPENLFDKDKNTKYCGTANVDTWKYVIFTCDTALNPTSIFITNSNDSAQYYPYRDFNEYKFYATNDDSLSYDNPDAWTLLGESDDIDFPTTNLTTFEIVF